MDKPDHLGRKHRIFTAVSTDFKASVCTWDLQFSFSTREQCMSFINELLETSDIPWNVSYEQREDKLHVVEIDGMSWANNLTFVARILERVDHKME